MPNLKLNKFFKIGFLFFFNVQSMAGMSGFRQTQTVRKIEFSYQFNNCLVAIVQYPTITPSHNQ